MQFLLDDVLDPVLASLMLATFAGSVIGLTGVSWIVRKLGRQSLLIFLLGSLVIVGGCLLVYVGIRDIVTTHADKDSFALGQLC
jgi:Na+/melibiose symporter-like transporter